MVFISCIILNNDRDNVSIFLNFMKNTFFAQFFFSLKCSSNCYDKKSLINCKWHGCLCANNEIHLLFNWLSHNCITMFDRLFLFEVFINMSWGHLRSLSKRILLLDEKVMVFWAYLFWKKEFNWIIDNFIELRLSMMQSHWMIYRRDLLFLVCLVYRQLVCAVSRPFEIAQLYRQLDGKPFYPFSKTKWNIFSGEYLWKWDKIDRWGEMCTFLIKMKW